MFTQTCVFLFTLCGYLWSHDLAGGVGMSCGWVSNGGYVLGVGILGVCLGVWASRGGNLGGMSRGGHLAGMSIGWVSRIGMSRGWVSRG